MNFRLMAIFAAGIVIGCLVVVTSYVSAYNYGNRMEMQLKAMQQNNENVLSSGYQQLRGVTGATKMATEDQIAIFRSAIEGRYGADGSKAVFQFIVEQNPQVDPALYRKVQQVVESTQREFQSAQTGLLDVKRSYETALGSFWQGFWLRVAGYPKINLAEYTIVSSDAAAGAFRTKRQRPEDFGVEAFEGRK